MFMNADDNWRKNKRRELIALRQAVSVSPQKRIAREVADELDGIIDINSRTIVSLYWPIQGELNLRKWMLATYQRGAKIALPVVVEKSKALVFRKWRPECKMERSIWNIPVPSESNIVTPTIVISPLVGYDPSCFRLGYGGGYFDRTLPNASIHGIVMRSLHGVRPDRLFSCQVLAITPFDTAASAPSADSITHLALNQSPPRSHCPRGATHSFALAQNQLFQSISFCISI
jgi:5,10-methenyltetrahydrofolate synthetase